MQTYIVRREATDITTNHAETGKPGDPWPTTRPLTVMHSHYGDGMDVTVTKSYPDGVIPAEDLETGALFRVTIERITEA